MKHGAEIDANNLVGEMDFTRGRGDAEKLLRYGADTEQVRQRIEESLKDETGAPSSIFNIEDVNFFQCIILR